MPLGDPEPLPGEVVPSIPSWGGRGQGLGSRRSPALLGEGCTFLQQMKDAGGGVWLWAECFLWLHAPAWCL